MTDHIAADQSGVDEQDVIYRITSIAPEGRKPLVFLEQDKESAQYFHERFAGSKLETFVNVAALSSNAAQSAGQEPVGYLIRYTNGDPASTYPWIYSKEPVKRDDVECKEIYTHTSSAAQVEEIRNAAEVHALLDRILLSAGDKEDKEFPRMIANGNWYDLVNLARKIKTAAPSKGEEIMETTEDLKKAYELLFAEVSVLRKQNERLLEYLTSAVENPEDSAYWLGSAKRFVDSLNTEGEKQNG